MRARIGRARASALTYGKLTVAEHEAGSEKMFAKMDKDGDGALSKAECDEGQKLMKKDK